MILSLLLVSILLVTVSAQYNFAVDINQPGTQNTFDCLRTNHFGVAFIRAYKPDGKGEVDYNGLTSVHMAYKAQLGVEVYMTPNPASSKPAALQVDEVLTALMNGGITVRKLWILITSPMHWNRDLKINNNFITVAIQRIRARGFRPGVYTNYYDWQQITDNMTGNLGSDVMLWYWNVLGLGVGGETAPDFSDFRPFGQWQYADVKQYGQSEPLCGLTLNKNAFPSSVSNGTNSGTKDVSDNGNVGRSIGIPDVQTNTVRNGTVPAKSVKTTSTPNPSTNSPTITRVNETPVSKGAASDIEGVVFLVLFFGIPVLIICCCAKCSGDQENHHHAQIGTGALPHHGFVNPVYPDNPIGTGALPNYNIPNPAYPDSPIGTGALPNYYIPNPVYPDNTIGSGALPNYPLPNPVYPEPTIGTGALPNYPLSPPAYSNTPIDSGALPYQGTLNPTYPSSPIGTGALPYQVVGNPAYGSAPSPYTDM